MTHANEETALGTPSSITMCRPTKPVPPTSYGHPGWAWGSLILPQMEQLPLYNQINFAATVVDYDNDTINLIRVASFICPADDPVVTFIVRDQNGKIADVPQYMPVSNYVGVFGTGSISEVPLVNDGIFGRNNRVSLGDITDGTSQTFAVGERRSDQAYSTWPARVPGGYLFPTALMNAGGPFGPTLGVPSCSMVLAPVGILDPPRTPNNGKGHPEDFSSWHSGGVNFLYADGTVRWVKDTISQRVFLSLATIKGGEFFSMEEY
jgi:prepilin-type processing-associated H-X9-DG protein